MSSYLEAIRQAAILFPILAVLFTVPYIAFNYHKYGSVLSMRILVVYSFVLYLLCVYCLVILPLPSSEAASTLRGHEAQLIPFAFVGDIMRTSHAVWNRPETWVSLFTCGAFLTTAFNLLMTMPFGMYLRYYFRCSWKKTLVLAALLSLFFELTQLSGLYFIYPGSYRMFDVDDLMVNTCGSMIGYLIAGLAARVLPTRERMDQVSFARGRRVSFLRRLVALLYDGIVLALAVVVLNLASTAFHWQVHLPEPAVQGLVLAYFALCPLLLGGSTVGHRLTRLKLATAEEIETIKKYAFAVNDILKAFWAECGVTLVDFKLEFGRLTGGTIVLADEISPDTCRLWDEKTHEKLDKDRFRRDLGGVEDAYAEIMKRLLDHDAE